MRNIAKPYTITKTYTTLTVAHHGHNGKRPKSSHHLPHLPLPPPPRHLLPRPSLNRHSSRATRLHGLHSRKARKGCNNPGPIHSRRLGPSCPFYRFRSPKKELSTSRDTRSIMDGENDQEIQRMSRRSVHYEFMPRQIRNRILISPRNTRPTQQAILHTRIRRRVVVLQTIHTQR